MKRCPICDGEIRPSYFQFQHASKEFLLSRCMSCDSLMYENEFFFDFRENFEHNRSLKIYLEKTLDLESLVSVVYNFINAFPENTKQGIDIGCGSGIVMDFIQTCMGKKMRGFEPSAHYSAEARETLKLDVVDDFFNAGYLENYDVDFAVCFQVIQMQLDPNAFIKEIRKVFSPQGVVIISTPDNYDLLEALDPVRHLPVLSPGAHRFIFSEKSLELLLAKAGFKSVKIFKRDGQLIAVASDNTIPTFDLFQSSREKLIAYYNRKLEMLSEESSCYKGIWYRLYRNYIDHGEYAEALALLEKADWFEIWTESEINGIDTRDRLFELNSSADAIIYYYTGILFLNYLQKFDYSQRFFQLSYQLGRKMIRLQPLTSIVEMDIMWHAKLHYAVSLIYNGDKQAARVQLIELTSAESQHEEWIPVPHEGIIEKANALMREIS